MEVFSFELVVRFPEIAQASSSLLGCCNHHQSGPMPPMHHLSILFRHHSRQHVRGILCCGQQLWLWRTSFKNVHSRPKQSRSQNRITIPRECTAVRDKKTEVIRRKSREASPHFIKAKSAACFGLGPVLIGVGADTKSRIYIPSSAAYSSANHCQSQRGKGSRKNGKPKRKRGAVV